MVPQTEEVTDSWHDLFDCTHTPLVLVSNYSDDVGPVERWVHPNNEAPELFLSAVLISEDYRLGVAHFSML
jgi:hypothetical protein